MVVVEFLDFINKLEIKTQLGFNDFSDRWNHSFTVLIFITVILVVTVKQYFFRPIVCYLVNPITSGFLMNDFTDNYCWIEGTIPFLRNDSIPEKFANWNEARKTKSLLYYQWVPFILSLQCIIYILPNLFWIAYINNVKGTNLQNLLNVAKQAILIDEGSDRDRKLSHIATIINDMFIRVCPNHSAVDLKSMNVQYLSFSVKKIYFFSFLRSIFNSTTFCYLILKTVYLLINLFQIWLMYAFLGFGVYRGDSSSFFSPSAIVFGMTLILNLANDISWHQSLYFPRITLCHVPVYVVGSNTNYLVAQCVLPVNMLSEKIYIFLWGWVLIGFCFTLVSLFVWLIRLYWQVRTNSMIKKHLKLIGILPDKNFVCAPVRIRCKVETNNILKEVLNYRIQNFLEIYSSLDQIFFFNMLEINLGEHFVSDVCKVLWEKMVDFEHSHFKFLCVDNTYFHDNSTCQKIVPLVTLGTDECHMGNTAAGGAASVRSNFSNLHFQNDIKNPHDCLPSIGFENIHNDNRINLNPSRLRKISLGAEPLAHYPPLNKRDQYLFHPNEPSAPIL